MIFRWSISQPCLVTPAIEFKSPRDSHARRQNQGLGAMRPHESQDPFSPDGPKKTKPKTSGCYGGESMEVTMLNTSKTW
jgi:hypothetical protein